MTKLMEWVSAFVVLSSTWLIFATNTYPNYLAQNYPMVLYSLPLLALIGFGVYAVTVVLYRVYHFNNCEDAAVLLAKEIEEAKLDLKLKGFVFKT